LFFAILHVEPLIALGGQHRTAIDRALKCMGRVHARKLDAKIS
jgi:hypothetical protein